MPATKERSYAGQAGRSRAFATPGVQGTTGLKNSRPPRLRLDRFHWNGRELILATPPKAPKLKALAKNPKVSLTIDDNAFPHKVLLIRGSASLQTVDGIVPEYAMAAERYFGREQGHAWVEKLRAMIPNMVRITVTPEWVGLLDFETRFPSALSS
jgi:hypothetical protein